MRYRCWATSILLVIASQVIAAPTPWKAGVAKVNITPKEHMWMSGYASRNKPAQGKLTDLWAKALVLEDGRKNRLVLITLDLVGIERDLALSASRELKKKHGLPREAIMIAVSHTHTGPVIRKNLNAMYFLSPEHQQKVNEYAVTLHRSLIQVVDQAIKTMAPAKIQWANGTATFAVNRRTNREKDVPKLRKEGKLKGPVDHQVPVLLVTNPKGAYRAIVFGYACHATVLSFFQWSGDYPGFAQIALEKAHPEAIALFWAGCGADQNPLPRRTVALAKKYGDQLAASVEAVLKKPMKTIEGNAAATYKEIPLPFADLPSREKLVADTTHRNRYVAARAKLLLERLKKSGSLKGTYPYPIQTWRLGSNLQWLALGGEVVVDFAIRLKKELGKENTWVTGYANDVMAYIPSLRVLREGGYEGGGAMVYYGLPTVWAPKVEELIVDEAHRQIKKTKR